MTRIDNWWVVARNPSFKVQIPLPVAPEFTGPRLNGEITDHPKHGNHPDATTSVVEFADALGHVHTRSGTTYQLGQPHPQYESLYPGARLRFLARLHQCI